jgi:hypothetical protein
MLSSVVDQGKQIDSILEHDYFAAKIQNLSHIKKDYRFLQERAPVRVCTEL